MVMISFVLTGLNWRTKSLELVSSNYACLLVCSTVHGTDKSLRPNKKINQPTKTKSDWPRNTSPRVYVQDTVLLQVPATRPLVWTATGPGDKFPCVYRPFVIASKWSVIVWPGPRLSVSSVYIHVPCAFIFVRAGLFKRWQRYPLDKSLSSDCFADTYPLDSNLSVG